LLFERAIHTAFFINLGAMQLKNFNNKITDLDQIKRGQQSKKRPFSTVAARTQGPSITKHEFIKYFD